MLIRGAQEFQGQIGLITYDLVPKIREQSDSSSDYLNKMAIVTLTFEENSYLPEWIEFHQKMGVDHFFIYDQNPNRDLRTLLRSQVESNIVTIVPWPNIWGISSQTLAYAHCISSHWQSFRWMMLTDIDEFVFPKYEDNLKTCLGKYDDYSAIYLYWRCFGSSGHDDPPSGYVIRNYTEMGLEPEDPWLKHEMSRIKAIVDPARCSQVRTHGCLVDGEILDNPHDILLNHYITRSRQEFIRKIDPSKDLWMWGTQFESWRKKRIAIFEHLESKYEENREILRVDPFG